MKKWFVVLCLSIASVAAFAQKGPRTSAQGKIAQEKQQIVLTSIMDEISDHRSLEDFHNMEAAVERKMAQAKAQEVQQTQTPVADSDGHKDVQQVVVRSDRPSYYAEEEAYKNYDGIDICKAWVQEQAQKDPHFQVLSAVLSMPDYHNQRLEVTYVMDVAEGKQVFEEDFGRWKQVE